MDGNKYFSYFLKGSLNGFGMVKYANGDLFMDS